MIFAEIKARSEHIDNFANYIKVNYKLNPIILIDSESQNKFVMKEEASKATILSFLENREDYKYGLTD